MPLAIRARAGAGASLLIGDGASPETFLRLAQVLTLKHTGKKLATEKTTNQDSSQDNLGNIWEELIGTIATGGTIDVTLNFVPTDTSQRALMNLWDGKAHNIQLNTPLDKTVSPAVPLASWLFPACLFDFPDIDLPLEKAMTLTLKLTLVGPDTVSWSQASPSTYSYGRLDISQEAMTTVQEGKQ
jgi:hypothetical protein